MTTFTQLNHGMMVHTTSLWHIDVALAGVSDMSLRHLQQTRTGYVVLEVVSFIQPKGPRLDIFNQLSCGQGGSRTSFKGASVPWLIGQSGTATLVTYAIQRKRLVRRKWACKFPQETADEYIA
jgi:hypothetical protein